MEVDPHELTETFLLELTGVSRLSSVKELNLSRQYISHLDSGLFSKLTALENLDLSGNYLTDIPATLKLKNLKKLDVSDNNLESADFAVNFPSLEDIRIKSNNIDQSEKHILLEVCPNICLIDNHRVEGLRNHTVKETQKLQQKVEATWNSEFSDKYCNRIPATQSEEVTKELVNKVKESGSKRELNKFDRYMLEKLATKLIEGIRSGSFPSPSKKPKTSLTPAKSKSPLKSPKFTPLKQRVPSDRLPSIHDYDPKHFVRCHHGDRTAKSKGCGDNDPKDEFTKIWHCTMEPDPYNPGKDTGLVATCGGETVCLLDYSTGQVMKRFKQPGEQFFALAWTTITIETDAGEKPTNILAVGGFNAYMKLLHPDQLICYKEWGTGRPTKSVEQGSYYTSCLLFHPQHKTWLFSGASDQSVTLWDIGIPKGPSHETTVSPLMIFSCDYEIINLLVNVTTCHLVAACDGGMVTWKLPRTKPDCIKPSKKQIAAEIVFPGDGDFVDGMTPLTDDLVATKSLGEGCIYVWNLSDCLSKVKNQRAVVTPLLTLDWKKTEQEYINLGYRNGLLACGDDTGSIWIYNLRDWIKKKIKPQSDEILKHSRMLKWPECEINSRREQEKQMTDVLDKPEPLIVNYLCFSESCEYLVAGTDNNLVCVWQCCEH